MKTVASHALGCKVNQYESEAIAELFQEKGYQVVDMEQAADVYIINTCKERQNLHVRCENSE